MKQFDWKGMLPHAIAVVLFAAISLAYFSPQLQGKKLYQSDNVHFVGMSKEIKDHREAHGEEALWTNAMFSGMPAYQISAKYDGNILQFVDKAFQGFLPRPAGLVYLYLIGFYILLMSMKLDYRLAIAGSIAFAFSSYFFIILEAGHNTKAHSIAYMAPLLASVLMAYRGRLMLGAVLTALFTSLMLDANHLQITYYLVMLFLIIGAVKLVQAVKENTLPSFAKTSAVLVLAGLLGTATNITRIWSTYEYGKDSMRGKSELTNDMDNKTSGLDKDYATAWSYGVAESFTLMIPNFHGGSSQGELGTDSEIYKAIRQSPQAKKMIKQLPLYWGQQPFTSGPVYAGAIVCFLFVMGLFLMKGYMRWWVLIGGGLMLALGWGKNFMPLTEFFLEYFPGYNKFRAVSTTLVIVELLLPFFGFVALQRWMDSSDKAAQQKAVKWAVIVVGGLAAVFALMPTMFFDFVGASDAQLKSMGWPVDALQADRAAMLSADAWRSVIFILLAAGGMWLYVSNTLKKPQLILLVGLLVLGDMWTVNKRYLNDDDFVSKRKVAEPYSPSQADLQIMADPDPNFRVFNTAVNTFNDASTSYFHKSIGGYHGAKLKRYQELIDAHISKGSMPVLNMLNTKYFISRGNNNQPVPQRNPGALGNAWFVSQASVVANADEELAALSSTDLANVAVVDQRFQEMLPTTAFDSTANIQLTAYKANHLQYRYQAKTEQLAVFSEIYYDKGWNAYIDGELVPHFRANYVLRAMALPAGSHELEFKFEPAVYHTGEAISLASSSILLLLLIGVLYKEMKA